MPLEISRQAQPPQAPLVGKVGSAAPKDKDTRCGGRCSYQFKCCGVTSWVVFLFLLALTALSKGGTGKTALDEKRRQQADAYMAGRIQAFQGADKSAGVAQVLKTLIPDGKGAKPVIDVQAPNTAFVQGRSQIQDYLEAPKLLPHQFKEISSDAKLMHGKIVVHFVLRIGSKLTGTNERLLAIFDFQEGSALIEKVTIARDNSKPLSSLDKERQSTVRKYMAGRIEAFQGQDKSAGVAQVLECFIPDGPDAGPVIDIRAPKSELAEGRDQIQKYLEGGPIVPCYFEAGSNTDPVIIDGKAIVHFVLRLGTSWLGKSTPLLATFEFSKEGALVSKVTVTNDS